MNERPLGELETARMQRHQGNGGRGLNISERQVNEGALGELEAANAETGSLNGVCTLPLSQCGRGVFALYSSCTGLWCSLVLWCMAPVGAGGPGVGLQALHTALFTDSPKP